MKVASVTLEDPSVHAHGGTLRTRATVRALGRLGHEVSAVYPRRPALRGNSPSGSPLHNIVVGVKRTRNRYLPMPTMRAGWDSDVRESLSSLRPELALISSLSQVRLAANLHIPYWLDFMDLWSDVAARDAATRAPVARATAMLQSRHLGRLERRAAHGATLVTTAGWRDAERLRRKGIAATWLPTTIPDEQFRTLVNPDARTLGFIGNFHYWPNRDAYTSLCDNWINDIAAHGWKILVAGLGSDDLPRVRHVEILGPVADVDDFYRRVSATIAPIRLGGGIKVKVIESLSRGVPVIGTEFAYEGFPPEDLAGLYRLDSGRPLGGELDALAPVDPTDPGLSPFRESTAQTQIARLLREAWAQLTPASRRET